MRVPRETSAPNILTFNPKESTLTDMNPETITKIANEFITQMMDAVSRTHESMARMYDEAEVTMAMHLALDSLAAARSEKEAEDDA